MKIMMKNSNLKSRPRRRMLKDQTIQKVTVKSRKRKNVVENQVKRMEKAKLHWQISFKITLKMSLRRDKRKEVESQVSLISLHLNSVRLRLNVSVFRTW